MIMALGQGHGKLKSLFETDEIRFSDPSGLGPVVSLVLVVFALVICAFLVMLGLFTRVALISMIITMETAHFACNFNDERFRD